MAFPNSFPVFQFKALPICLNVFHKADIKTRAPRSTWTFMTPLPPQKSKMENTFEYC